MAGILVYHAGALGDFVTLLPALRLVRVARPGARVTLLGRPHHGELARDGGLVDTVLDAGLARYRSLWSGSPDPESGEVLDGFEQALLLTVSMPLVAAARARIPRVDHQPPQPTTRLGAYVYHARFVAEALGLGAEEIRPHLEPPLIDPWAASAGADVNHPAVGRVWLHPGSGSPAKCWPPGRYGRLAEALRRRGRRIAWSFGPADHDLASGAELGLRPDEPVSRDEPPLGLARGLARAAVYVGADTGVTHLAAAVGCPVVAIFGPTDPAVWRPAGAAVRVLRAAGTRAPGDVQVSDVLGAVEELAAAPPRG